jgi:hypothetical protein
MSECSLTRSDSSKNWPEGVISVKMTMNPYLLAMAIEEALKSGLKPWELINVALWEKLGCPNQDTLMEFAANLELEEEDPKWKKRLKITARHEVEVESFRKMVKEKGDAAYKPSGNGSSEREE